ncbi:MAG: hypothetical protein AAGF90_03710, partial [Pseudomonadota bacterium]
MDKTCATPAAKEPPSGTVHPLFYQNANSTEYKKDEKVLRLIIKKNIVPKQAEDSIKLTIYYKNRKTSSLVMRNNLS